MANVIEGTFEAKDLKIGLAVSRFNEFVTRAMLEGALNELRRMNISESDLYVVWVPGAYEIPFVCESLIRSQSPDAIVAIGCIIKGETSHYEHIAQSVLNGLQTVALSNHIPIGLGVITVENLAQAMDRSGGKQGNKGRDAARSAVEMAQAVRRLQNKGAKEAHLKKLVEQEIRQQ